MGVFIRSLRPRSVPLGFPVVHCHGRAWGIGTPPLTYNHHGKRGRRPLPTPTLTWRVRRFVAAGFDRQCTPIKRRGGVDANIVGCARIITAGITVASGKATRPPALPNPMEFSEPKPRHWRPSGPATLPFYFIGHITVLSDFFEFFLPNCPHQSRTHMVHMVVLHPLWCPTTPTMTRNAYHVTHKVQSAFEVCLVHL